MITLYTSARQWCSRTREGKKGRTECVCAPKRQECGGQRKGPETISGTRSPRPPPRRSNGVVGALHAVVGTPYRLQTSVRAHIHKRMHEMTVRRRGETMMTVVTLFIGPVLGMSADKNQTVRARPDRVPRSPADDDRSRVLYIYICVLHNTKKFCLRTRIYNVQRITRSSCRARVSDCVLLKVHNHH